VNWKIIYDFPYLFHKNIGHNMPHFWDISLNRSQMFKSDFSELLKLPLDWFHSLHTLAQHRYSPKRSYMMKKDGSTSVLVNSFWQYGWKSEKELNPTFLTFKWAFQPNFTFNQYPPGEDPCQIREQVNEQFLRNLKNTPIWPFSDISNLAK